MYSRTLEVYLLERFALLSLKVLIVVFVISAGKAPGLRIYFTSISGSLSLKLQSKQRERRWRPLSLSNISSIS